MKKIFPFSGVRYQPELFPDLSQVVAPPYDVIDEPLQVKLQGQSDHNVVWIDLPPKKGEFPDYEFAAKKYQAWKKAGALIKDKEPGLYLYFQSYTLADGREFTRKGFFARRRLESFENGGVKPHEKTFAGPKADRLKLTQATRANLSPIFGLYPDPKNHVGPRLEEISQGEAFADFKTEEGYRHRMWRVADPALIEGILEEIQSQHILIADGHHRYETALNYRELRKNELAEAYTGEEGFNFVLMYLCALEDPGLVVLPTHRVLSERPNVEPELVQQLLASYAEIKDFAWGELKTALEFMEQEGERDHVIGWVHDRKIQVLAFDREKLLNSEELNRLHYALRDLDVTILHNLILEEILGVSKGAQREYGTLKYIKKAEDVLKVTQENNSYGFLLNATKVAQMEAVTQIGETMPQKSTFFYPKVPTGLIFNDLD